MEMQDRDYEKIRQLCAEGDDFAEDALYEKAIEKYLKALAYVPKPKSDWEASTWIYTALGDVCYQKIDYENAKQYLYDALNCPDAVDNPFILLRLGQTLTELKEMEKAREYLLRAYMLEGYAIFREEDDKYFDVIKDDV